MKKFKRLSIGKATSKNVKASKEKRLLNVHFLKHLTSDQTCLTVLHFSRVPLKHDVFEVHNAYM